MAATPVEARLAALQLVALSLPRAPAVLLRSGTLLALGSASQWRESESLSLSVSGVNLSHRPASRFKLVRLVA